MKTKKLRKKLELNKLTLSNLDPVQQEVVKGGIETVTCTMVQTCHCPHTPNQCNTFLICS